MNESPDPLFAPETASNALIVTQSNVAERGVTDSSQAIQSLERLVDHQLTNLNAEIKTACRNFEKSSRSSNTLLRWTGASTVASACMVLLTAGTLYVSNRQVDLAMQALRVQVVPEITFQVNFWPGANTVVIRNAGAYPVFDLGVDYNLEIYFGEPFYRRVMGSSQGGLKDLSWSHLDKLEPGESQEYSLSDIAHEAEREEKLALELKSHGNIPGVPKHAQPEVVSIIKLKLVVHREIDRKRFQYVAMGKCIHEVGTGRLTFEPIDLEKSPFPQLQYPAPLMEVKPQKGSRS